MQRPPKLSDHLEKKLYFYILEMKAAGNLQLLLCCSSLSLVCLEVILRGKATKCSLAFELRLS